MGFPAREASKPETLFPEFAAKASTVNYSPTNTLQVINTVCQQVGRTFVDVSTAECAAWPINPFFALCYGQFD